MEPAAVHAPLSSSLLSLPLDFLAEISRYLAAVDAINFKYLNRLMKSKMERGGLASFRIAPFDGAPKSPTWLLPVIKSRLTELEVTCNAIPHLEIGILRELPNSLKRISLNFPTAMALLEPLPRTPGVTKTARESYKLMELDSYFPELQYLALVDSSLTWRVDKDSTFNPSPEQLHSFIAHLPKTLRSLRLQPFPASSNRISGLPPYLQALHINAEPSVECIDLPPSLTSLHLYVALHPPKISYNNLCHLKELSLTMDIPSKPTLPDSLHKLRLSNAAILDSQELPKELTDLNLGFTSNPDAYMDRLPTDLLNLTMDTSATFDLKKLPRGLRSLRCGSTTSQVFRLGFSDTALSSLPPELTSLTLVGKQRLTHQCWLCLPNTLRVLNLPQHQVNAGFIKLVPHTLTELSVGLLQFSFKDGISLLEDCSMHLEIPNSLVTILLSKILPSHLIFTFNRSECDLKDSSASSFPSTLLSLTIIGSQVGITDEFIRLLPRKLHTLRMPNQMNFTSRILSYLPPALHTLELDGSGISPEQGLPLHLKRVSFTSSAANQELRRSAANKVPK